MLADARGVDGIRPGDRTEALDDVLRGQTGGRLVIAERVGLLHPGEELDPGLVVTGVAGAAWVRSAASRSEMASRQSPTIPWPTWSSKARAKKGEFTFSSGGVGTSHHMSGVLLEMRSGVKMTHVPYRATPAGIQAVVNGEVQMGMFNTPTVVGLIRAGKLKALAVTSQKRLDQFPELPTMIELGFKDFVVDTWLGFGAPAGLPQPLVTRLNGEFNRITNLPEMRKKFDEQGIIAWPSRSPEAALKFLHQDSDILAAHHQGLGGDRGITPSPCLDRRDSGHLFGDMVNTFQISPSYGSRSTSR